MNIAVIGIGKLGSLHAKIYNQMPAVKTLYLCDTNPAQISLLQSELTKKIETVSDYSQLLNCDIQAVSIATPTVAHFGIARAFLNKKIPCLIEKPITTTLPDAKELYQLAKKNKTVLMVGHVERFNSAYPEALKLIKNPLFIECHRLNPYPAGRSLDIGVVLDLMIHDLDIILDLVKDTPKHIDATGVTVLSKTEDIANVRIVFKKGCIANITASRISPERVRKIRVFTRDSYISLDYAKQEIDVYRKEAGILTKKNVNITKEQPLQKELAFFIEQIHRKNVSCLPDHAIEALSLALTIERKIQKRHA